MARTSRRKSVSGYYHVIIRGVNKQDIFCDDRDWKKMLECMCRFQEQTAVVICAYCLMRNHVHLLIYADDRLDLFIKKLASSYVFYFNHKYERVGHLFQDRYRSEPVEDEHYLLAVFRYILQNPWKAGICRPEEYKWSSWKSVTGQKTICNIEPLIDIVGDYQSLMTYVLLANSDEFLETETKSSLSESKALREVQRIMHGEDPLKITQFPREKREEILLRMKESGLSIRQISKITGINRNTVQRA